MQNTLASFLHPPSLYRAYSLLLRVTAERLGLSLDEHLYLGDEARKNCVSEAFSTLSLGLELACVQSSERRRRRTGAPQVRIRNYEALQRLRSLVEGLSERGSEQLLVLRNMGGFDVAPEQWVATRVRADVGVEHALSAAFIAERKWLGDAFSAWMAAPQTLQRLIEMFALLLQRAFADDEPLTRRMLPLQLQALTTAEGQAIVALWYATHEIVRVSPITNIGAGRLESVLTTSLVPPSSAKLYSPAPTHEVTALHRIPWVPDDDEDPAAESRELPRGAARTWRDEQEGAAATDAPRDVVVGWDEEPTEPEQRPTPLLAWNTKPVRARLMTTSRAIDSAAGDEPAPLPAAAAPRRGARLTALALGAALLWLPSPTGFSVARQLGSRSPTLHHAPLDESDAPVLVTALNEDLDAEPQRTEPPDPEPNDGLTAASTVIVRSRPKGAAVYVHDRNRRQVGVTPVTIAVPAPNAPTTLLLRLPGYKDRPVTVAHDTPADVVFTLERAHEGKRRGERR